MEYGFTPSQVEKAREAIDFLSSLSLPAGCNNRKAPQSSNPQSFNLPQSSNPQSSNPPQSSKPSSGSRKFFSQVAQAADLAVDALRKMRNREKPEGGMKRKAVKQEMNKLFSGKKAKTVWRHKFDCCAYTVQNRSPTTDFDKEELYRAGLGEKEIVFEDMDINQSDFKKLLLDAFPRLKAGGGFRFLKGVANSRNLELLSMATLMSPAILKQRVGNSRTYIRPLQRDLDLNPMEEKSDVLKEKCLTCGLLFSLDDLPRHATECKNQTVDLTTPTFSDDERDLPNVTVRRTRYEDIQDDEDALMEDALVEEALVEEALEESRRVNVRCTRYFDQAASTSSVSDPTDNVTASTCEQVIRSCINNVILRDIDPFAIEVRRVFIVRDALKETKKKKFIPNKPIKVNFTGEGAIDHGGPRREFFRLLGCGISDLCFHGLPECKFFLANVSALQERSYFYLGQYAAMSILQGGIGLPYFSQCVYKYFTCGVYSAIDVPIEEIPESTLQWVVQKIEESETDSDIQVAISIDEANSLLHETGFSRPVCMMKVSDKHALRSALLDYHCMIKVKCAMDQFIEGLQRLKVHDLIKQYPELMKDLFVAVESDLTADRVKEMFTVKFSSPGSNRRVVEEQTWTFFGDFLDECDESVGDSSCDCAVHDVVIFFSGSKRIPPLGFERQPTLEFLHDQRELFCSASTCDLIMRLPTKHDNYASFREAITMSLIDNDGFGGV